MLTGTIYRRSLTILLGVVLPLAQFAAQPQLPTGWQAIPILLCGVLVVLASRQLSRRDLMQVLVAGTAAWWLLSAALSGQPFPALGATLSWGAPLLGFYLFFRQANDPTRLLSLFLLATGSVAVLLWVYSFVGSPNLGKAAIRPFFPNANLFSAFLSLLLPGLVWVAGRGSLQGGFRWWAGAMALVLAVALIALRSRGAWVGLGGGGLVFLYFWLDDWRQRGLLLAAGLALALVSGGILRQYFNERPQLPEGMQYVLSAGDTEQDFSNQERIMRWVCAVRMWQEEPVLGHGPGLFAPDFKHQLRSWEEVQRISYWFGWTGGAHSVWLSALAETGLPGLLGLLAVLGLFFRRVGRAVAGPNRGLALAAAAAVGAWVTHGLVDDLLMSVPLAGLLGLWMAVSEGAGQGNAAVED